MRQECVVAEDIQKCHNFDSVNRKTILFTASSDDRTTYHSKDMLDEKRRKGIRNIKMSINGDKRARKAREQPKIAGQCDPRRCIMSTYAPANVSPPDVYIANHTCQQTENKKGPKPQPISLKGWPR